MTDKRSRREEQYGTEETKMLTTSNAILHGSTVTGEPIHYAIKMQPLSSHFIPEAYLTLTHFTDNAAFHFNTQSNATQYQIHTNASVVFGSNQTRILTFELLFFWWWVLLGYWKSDLFVGILLWYCWLVVAHIKAKLLPLAVHGDGRQRKTKGRMKGLRVLSDK